MPREKMDTVQIPFCIPREDANALRALSKKTGVSQQHYARQAIAALLVKHGKEVRS